ncbi:MAG: sulfurtransferase TusB [Sulfurihydrogenibium sp.]|jgi:tRNA 2-thiouridine synthesizing protein B|uniref:sulfurtransferase TusB n=1 Tax=Sulfurihydrogenibium sp. TaxID=2053621 RepID=UPI000CBA60AB|nr:MAG: sulfurtransferase TusB [Sulfurihydrogenibium sp.]PMP76944.1 MAG: sulfurtransferase TusB [Sulfurihydrogenibium sp.]
MVDTVYLIKKPADFPIATLISDNDVLILIQDAVLRQPSIDNWYACKEDAVARAIKIPESRLLDYDDILNLIEKANKVVVW